MRAALLATALLACGGTSGESYVPPSSGAVAVTTAHTTRLPASDPETQAVVVAQTAWAGTRPEAVPGAVVLCAQDPWLALTAAHRLPHAPVGGPLLYLKADGTLGARTRDELRRLRPRGVAQDGRVQVYVVGEADPDVLSVLRDDLGYRVRAFEATEPAALADELDRWRAALDASWPDVVVVSPLGDEAALAHGLGALGWSARLGSAFAWAEQDDLPDATRRILDRRWAGAKVLLTGAPHLVGDAVLERLAAHGPVARVGGADAVATQVVAAAYEALGPHGLTDWLGVDTLPAGAVGRDVVVGHVDDLLGVTAAALLARPGRPAPVLLVERHQVPEPVRGWLEAQRPTMEAAGTHAWIVGDEEHVSWAVQRDLELLLRPRVEEVRVTGVPGVPDLLGPGGRP